MMDEFDLHDASLMTLEIDWMQGILRCTFKVGPSDNERAILTARGLRSFSSPRKFPWGPSFSVNSFRRSPAGVSIEMQSGDTIDIEADSIKIEGARP